VIGVVPYVGLNFGVYETLKHMLLAHYGYRDERELSVPERLGCGAAAGTMGQTVAYPFDVARRRLQVGVLVVGSKVLGGDDVTAVSQLQQLKLCCDVALIAP
jgi:solute carrier family 25 phosphate transporter 23/24/25/41